MSLIKELDTQLANKIAAGEVIERPASVVKELVENAIDAKSTEITVKIYEAGLQSISVIDNGTGIAVDDIELAFGRHATSKIHDDHDLFHIRTLGFRGEALASITSVSEVEMKTCTGNESVYASVKNGVITDQKPTRLKRGTEITVSNLFYNTPARLKYIKSLQTEHGKITDIMNRFALSYPHIRFNYYNEDKLSLRTTGSGKLGEVMGQVYGMKVSNDLIKVSGETGDYSITGMVAKPEHTRSNRHYISIFINGRYIKNYILTKAILDGYHTLLPIGRFPIVALHITMDPGLVDVNVHPTKQEVRLSKETELKELIATMIKNALTKEMLIPQIKIKKQKPSEIFEQQKIFYEEQQSHKQAVNENTEPINQLDDTVQGEHQHKADTSTDKQINYEEVTEDIKSEPFIKATEEMNNISPKLPYMEVVGQVHGTYIIAQNDQGMYMIDQHAAQERIKYEFYKHRMNLVNNEVQPLLVPINLSFSKDEALRILEYVDQLKAIGLELEPFGSNDFIIQAVPTWFPNDAALVIDDIITFILENKSMDLNKFRENTAIMMSCKRSIKANHYLTRTDMERLIEELSYTNEPYTCPHGRPITILLSSYDIEKLFKRVM